MGLFDFFRKKPQTQEEEQALDKGLEKTKEGFLSKITKAVVVNRLWMTMCLIIWKRFWLLLM